MDIFCLCNTIDLDKIAKYISIIQAVLTIIAIIVGGFWTYWLFWKKRQIFPHVNITHKITHKAITNNKLLLHVDVNISNVGDVLLSLAFLETRIQQVLPLTSEHKESIEKGENIVEEGETEVKWQLLDSKELKCEKGIREIEPGESEPIHYDFILSSEVELLEVYTYLKNIKKRGREIGWNLTTVYDIKEGSSNN